MTEMKDRVFEYEQYLDDNFILIHIQMVEIRKIIKFCSPLKSLVRARG